MTDHRSYTHNLSSCKIKAWEKKSGLNGIQTHDLCNTSAVLYQLSYQANCRVFKFSWHLLQVTSYFKHLHWVLFVWQILLSITLVWTAEEDHKAWLITTWPALSWLDSSVDGALHQYHRSWVWVPFRPECFLCLSLWWSFKSSYLYVIKHIFLHTSNIWKKYDLSNI